MAGWLKIADGSALDCLEKIRSLFDRFVSICVKEICGSHCLRPLPPMLGDGKIVDLFKLYLVVREKGGFETVSNNGLWDSVAKESGMDSISAPAMKLIYSKYLDTLDKWLQRFLKDKGSKVKLEESEMRLDEFLESEFKGFLSEISHFDLEKNELNLVGVGDEEHDIILETSVVEEDGSSRKRKWECDLKMLDWVRRVAKDPCDMGIGSLPERSKWKSYGGDRLWKQVLLAREAMLLKKDGDSSAQQSIWQKKQKMHPTMYEDYTGSERSRCSQRIHSVKELRALLYLKKYQAGASSESASFIDDPYTTELWVTNQFRKRIPVGPHFQAKLPEWSGSTYESDSKWLGTRVWPLEKRENRNHMIERDQIGEGRQDFCGCESQGSIECVRFHVAKKRMRVKLDLCSAFHCWKFDKMGEEVALSWTQEEEKKFGDIVKLNPPSLEKCFWDEMFKSLTSKNRGELVSYYFNVFLIQRRQFQNRHTPNNIDSDDDESDGSVTNGVKDGGSKFPSSILCSPKKVHLNFR